MDGRRTLRNLALGVLGLAAAVAIGLAANTISGDSVGLSAEPLSPGESLAPPRADTTPRTAPKERPDPRGHHSEHASCCGPPGGSGGTKAAVGRLGN